ncbi:MAG: hypothetical protein K2O89_06920 [Clostridia bacterium]|nr:hypothetical protein [Clostridia bacterium]
MADEYLEKYIKTLLENMQDNTRNKVLDLVGKSGYSIPGWTKLSKVPDGLLAKKFYQSDSAFGSLIKHACMTYFNTCNEEDLRRLLYREPLNSEWYSGYLAALACLGDEDSDYAEKLMENGIAEQADQTVKFKDEEPIVKEKAEVKKMRLLGYIKVVQADRWDYFNFHPLMYLDEKNNLVTINNVQAEFPNRGNIFLYTRIPDSSLIYDNFLNQNHYVLDIDKDDLELNYKKYSTTEINETNYKLNVENLIYKKKSSPISDNGLFYVATPKDLINEEFNYQNDIHIEDENFFIDDIVLLKLKDRLIGPFKIAEDESDHSLVVKFTHERNYVYTTYFCEEGEINDHLFKLRSGYSDGEIRKTVVQVSKGFKKVDIDYINDDNLLNGLSDFLSTTKQTGTINSDNINIIKDNLVKNSTIVVKNNPKLTENRFKRLSEIIQSSEFIENNINKFAEIFKKFLIRAEKDNLSQFDIILKKISEDKEFLCQLFPKYKAFNDELEDLKEAIAELEKEKDDIKKRQLEEIYKQNERLREEKQQLEKEKQELDVKISEIKKEFKLADDIKQLEWRKDYLLNETAKLENKQNTQLKAIQETIGNIFNSEDMSREIAESIKNDGISQAIIDASAYIAREKDQSNYAEQVDSVSALEGLKLSGNELVEDLIGKIRLYRGYEYNDIANLLICITQGFITIFSGEPGTGKTSICNILGHALGLDGITPINSASNNNRYISVSVERGWTSKRDLIGYYNPLTKTFDSGNNHIYAALKVLNQEVKSQKVKFPMIILLDEANLSPMEYYWADFMNLCDDKTDLDCISIGNNEVLSIPKTLRFVGTINNDHTTELLSPRLVDRAWIIVLPNCPEGKVVDLVFNETNDPVVWDNLYDALNSKDAEPSVRVKKILEESYKRFKDVSISVSPRADKAIRKYIAVAQNIFKDEDSSYKDIVAADYAILQKLLTKINGNGEKYKEALERLRDYFKDIKLNRCAAMVSRILQKGDAMKYYKYF